MDDLSRNCTSFILEQYNLHQGAHDHSIIARAPPLFLGINGIQGAGKTTLVSALISNLSSPPHNLNTIAFSIDDLYLRRADQVALAKAHPQNRLIQHRGQPGTHEIALGLSTFRSLREGTPTSIPRYDKSAFNGKGDREDPRSWRQVNTASDTTVDIVLFEGWCVGFRPLESGLLASKWEIATREMKPHSRLWRYELEELVFVNEALRDYDCLTNQLDALIHIDAENLDYVYEWRRQQEAELRASKGSGMLDAEVTEFVDGYYPAYELYTDDLRNGAVCKDGRGHARGTQLRLLVDRERTLKYVERI